MPDQLTLGKLITTEDTAPVDTDFVPTIKANGDGRRVAQPILLSKGRPDIWIASADEGKAAYADYICTGTNDHLKIHEARDAIDINKGGLVRLSPGLFDIRAPVIWNRPTTILQGSGAPERRSGASPDSLAGTVFLVNTTNSFANGDWVFTIQDADLPATQAIGHVTLQNLAIDLNDRVDVGVAGGVLNGLLVKGYRCLIRRVNVWRASGTYVEAQMSGTWAPYETNFELCQVGYSPATAPAASNHAFVANGSDTVWRGIQCSAIKGSGFVNKAGGTQCYEHHLTGMGPYGLWVQSANTVKFHDGKIENAQKHLVFLDNTIGGILNVSIHDNDFRGASQELANTYSHVFSGGSGTDGIVGVSLQGNQYGETIQSTNNVKYAIELSNTKAQRWTIMGETFDYAANMQTGVIYDNADPGHPTVITGNNGQPGATVGNYVVRASGTATVPNGATSVAVVFTNPLSNLGPRHGISAEQIVITPTNNLGIASHWWVTAVSLTGFTLNVDADPGATTATFRYRVDIED